MPNKYAQYMHRRQYELEFTEPQWEEIVNLGFEPFEVVPEESLTRGQWMAVADMALGKAWRLDRGDYALGEPDEAEDNERWAEELREIAHIILNKLRPGDGQI